MATLVLESVGSQRYVLRPDEFLTRLTTYGAATADLVRPFLRPSESTQPSRRAQRPASAR